MRKQPIDSGGDSVYIGGEAFTLPLPFAHRLRIPRIGGSPRRTISTSPSGAFAMSMTFRRVPTFRFPTLFPEEFVR